MRKPTALDSFERGRRERLSFPLSSGRYNLVEYASRMEKRVEEICRIRD